MNSTRNTPSASQPTSTEIAVARQLAENRERLNELSTQVLYWRDELSYNTQDYFTFRILILQDELDEEEEDEERKRLDSYKELIRMRMISLNRDIAPIVAEQEVLSDELNRLRRARIISIQDYLLAEAKLR